MLLNVDLDPCPTLHWLKARHVCFASLRCLLSRILFCASKVKEKIQLMPRNLNFLQPDVQHGQLYGHVVGIVEGYVSVWLPGWDQGQTEQCSVGSYLL